MEKQESNYNMIDWWKKVVFKNYANFTGRARRSEYWYFILFNIIILVPVYVIALITIEDDNSPFAALIFGLAGLCILGLIVPWLAVVVRRLHDLNKSGWYYFIRFIPLVGPIIFLVWLCTDGDRFTNQYGDDPKNIATPEFDFDQTN